jgi:hypothetical protein
MVNATLWPLCPWGRDPLPIVRISLMFYYFPFIKNGEIRRRLQNYTFTYEVPICDTVGLTTVLCFAVLTGILSIMVSRPTNNCYIN